MTQTILVIDDEHSVRKLICEILQFAGYRVLQASDGHDGARLAAEIQPDLILCDVSMPGMDGFATLTAIRQEARLALTPFIFLTGRVERQDIRQGMASGADDYITKPFSATDLIEAVRARLARKSEVLKHNEKQLDALRGNIVHMLPHELRTPLQGIMGFADILADDYKDLDREQIGDLARRVMRSAQRLHRVVENFLVYAQIQVYSKDPEKLSDLREQSCPIDQQSIEEVVRECAGKAGRQADVVVHVQPAHIRQSSDDLRKIIEELVDNAFKFSTDGNAVTITGKNQSTCYDLIIEDSGRGMSQEQINSIGACQQFDRKFHEQQGTGLGLAIARELVNLHEGKLTIESEPDAFTRVTISYSLADAEGAQPLAG